MAKTEENGIGGVREAKAMARRIIEHHFGSKPKRMVHQASGLSNFVFLIYHAEGEFIVRISLEPAKINAYIKEQWATAKVNELGVPTSEILEVGNEIISHPYMVSHRANGREATHHPDRLSILHEMGRYAALINSISTEGFGKVFDWSSNQLSRNETWSDFLASEILIESRLKIFKKYKIFTPQKLKKLRTTLESAEKKSLKPFLNHGDMRLKNVLVDKDGKIVAIIDWEDCISSLAPQWELSIALHDLSIDEKQEFLDGYGINDKKFAEIAPLTKAINIINYAPYVEQIADAGDDVQLEKYKTRLNGMLDLYSF